MVFVHGHVAHAQETFEKNLSRELVHGFGAFGDADATILQNATGFDGGHTLIPKLNQAASAARQIICKFARVLHLTAFPAIHMQGQPQQYKANIILNGDAFECGDIGTERGALEGRQALSGDAQRVTERQSDAFFA